MVIALFLATAPVLDSIEVQFPVLERERAIVDDAQRRWIAKNGNDVRAINGRVPIVMEIIDERCVILRLNVLSIGGTPVYCYKTDEDRLTRFKDDVE